MTSSAQVEAIELYRKLGFTVYKISVVDGPLPLMHHTHGMEDFFFEYAVPDKKL